MSATLLLQFEGWCVIRLATDPDPHDEPRGVSGYTFALAGEPDLDRVIHLQPSPGLPVRSHSPKIGVSVRRATRQDSSGETDVPALRDARVELLDQPRLENRNEVLTQGGFEPIVPFHLRITADSIVLRRKAPLDPDHPDVPVWQVPEALLRAQGASGITYEPETIGRATGIWNSLQVTQERLEKLRTDLAELERRGGDPIASAALQTRIAELEYAVRHPSNRRVTTRYLIERFNFPIAGAEVEIQFRDGDAQTLLGGELERSQPWPISFWFGAWDPDLLCAYMQGALQIPYRSE